MINNMKKNIYFFDTFGLFLFQFIQLASYGLRIFIW